MVHVFLCSSSLCFKLHKVEQAEREQLVQLLTLRFFVQHNWCVCVEEAEVVLFLI